MLPVQKQNWLANIVGADSVGAGDAERVQTEVADGDIDERLRAGDLAGVADSPRR